jgi:outer membrane protein assembly factor BamB
LLIMAAVAGIAAVGIRTFLQNTGPSRDSQTSSVSQSFSATGQSAAPIDGKGAWLNPKSAYSGDLGIDFNAEVNYKVASDGTNAIVTVTSFSDVPAQVKAFDGATGKEVWSFPLPNNARSAAYVSDNVAVQVSGREYIAIDTATGKELWRKASNGNIGILGTPQGVSRNGVFYYAYPQKNNDPDVVVGVDIRTGAVKYQATDFSGTLDQALSIALAGDTIIVQGLEAGTTAYSADLSKVWEFNESAGQDAIGKLTYGKLYGFGNYVILHDQFGGKTVALDNKTGKKVWEKTLAKANDYVVIGDILINPNGDNSANPIQAVNLRTGEVAWEQKKSIELFSQIAVVDNTLFEVGHGMSILDPKTGKPTTTIKRKYGNSVPVSASGHLIVVGPDGVFGYK